MKKNVKFIVYLMKKLGVSGDDVKNALVDTELAVRVESADVIKAIEAGTVSFKKVFAPQSPALKKLLRFIEMSDFIKPNESPKTEQENAPKTEPEKTPAKSSTSTIVEKKDTPCGEDNKKTTTASSDSISSKKIEFSVRGNGITYARCEGRPIGIVINSMLRGKFILALREHGRNQDITVAQREAENLPAIAGKKWIVPSDDHFKAIRAKISQINATLRELGGDEISRDIGYLSSTSQQNQPARWNVRFVLPID